MELEHHDLAHEFPEFKDAIHGLRMSNAHFARLFAEYAETDKEIRRIEKNIEPVSDAYAEDLKKKRLLLKDELYGMLRGK